MNKIFLNLFFIIASIAMVYALVKITGLEDTIIILMVVSYSLAILLGILSFNKSNLNINRALKIYFFSAIPLLAALLWGALDILYRRVSEKGGQDGFGIFALAVPTGFIFFIGSLVSLIFMAVGIVQWFRESQSSLN